LIPKSLHIQANRHARHAGLVLQHALIPDVQNFMGHHSGSQRADPKERSPLYKADQVQGPILLMHGVHDPRVKVSQSLQMAEALRTKGKPVELVLFDKAGHGFQRWQDNLIAYRKTEDFLAKCLGRRTGGFDFFELGAKLF
jgi:dipeptidyl aminopeptidase/acylaminoacyl peptidase